MLSASSWRFGMAVGRVLHFVVVVASLTATMGQQMPHRNVLFIAVDDMRPSIGAFNFSLASTPHMDQLARSGLVFKRAFVQYAFCAPSRNSFMSGRRPDTTRVWNFFDHFRQSVDSSPSRGAGGELWRSMPEYFKTHGFVTMGSGKLFHPAVPPDNDWPRSWSTNYSYYSPECMPAGVQQGPVCPNSVAPRGHKQRGSPSGAFKCVSSDPHGTDKGSYTLCPTNTSKDEQRFEFQLEDQRILHSCLDQLHAAASLKKHFFIGCGFHKPHVPWEFPAEFLDLYPKDLNDIPLATDPYAPVGMPQVAWHPPADVHGMNIPFNGTCNETRARNFRRGYYAAISYTDHNIGVLLNELDTLNLTQTTTVVVMGDHGWQLGEHDTWAKMTNFEVALRTPLIIRAPWKNDSVGRTTDVLAEAVDLYPTLAALAGLPPPESEGEEVNGTNLEPVFDDPVGNAGIKTAAFSQFAKPSLSQPFKFWPTPQRNATEVMGYTVRVNEWRYTCWFKFNKTSIVPITTDDGIISRELYSHVGDPGILDWEGEHINVVQNVKYADIVTKLHEKLVNYIKLYPV